MVHDCRLYVLIMVKVFWYVLYLVIEKIYELFWLRLFQNGFHCIDESWLQSWVLTVMYSVRSLVYRPNTSHSMYKSYEVPFNFISEWLSFTKQLLNVSSIHDLFVMVLYMKNWIFYQIYTPVVRKIIYRGVTRLVCGVYL